MRRARAQTGATTAPRRASATRRSLQYQDPGARRGAASADAGRRPRACVAPPRARIRGTNRGLKSKSVETREMRTHTYHFTLTHTQGETRAAPPSLASSGIVASTARRVRCSGNPDTSHLTRASCTRRPACRPACRPRSEGASGLTAGGAEGGEGRCGGRPLTQTPPPCCPPPTWPRPRQACHQAAARAAWSRERPSRPSHRP